MDMHLHTQCTHMYKDQDFNSFTCLSFLTVELMFELSDPYQLPPLSSKGDSKNAYLVTHPCKVR